MPVLAATLLVLAAAQLRAPEQQADPVIRVSVDLVQVDAVVTDVQGRHVADLKPEDFTIFEDGKPQKTTHLSYVPGVAVQPALKQLPKQDGGPPAQENLSRPRALRPEEVRRTIVMIADDLGLSSDDIPNVRKAMKSFADGQMQPGDLVSIMRTSGGAGAMEQLTNDKRQLYAVIERIRYVQGRVGQTWYEPTNCCSNDREVENAKNRRLNAIRFPAAVTDTLGAVAYAIQGMREMPGRKAIALFSGGFAQSAGGIVELANRASVVLYTFDPRGLASFFLTAADVCTGCAGAAGPRKIGAFEQNREATYHASQRSLAEMARGTGGIFFHDNNDLAKGLADALDDMAGYYLIGYQPQREDFDLTRGVVPFHKIEVKILRPGLQVRSRNGFLGTPDAPAMSSASTMRSAKGELQKALFSPFHANGFPLQLNAFYSAAIQKNLKTNRRQTLLRAMVAIDPRSLRFGDGPNGRKTLDIEVVAAAYGANNEAVATSDRTFTAAMTAEEMSQIVASGLVYGLDIEIPKPGPYQLRVAVWDANAQQTGSATTFVDIPDFNRAAIAVSSVLLSDSDSKRNEELAREGVMGAGSFVTRMFMPGAVLTYDCTVFDALTDRRTGKPKVDIEVRLYRGPEQIFSGRPIPLAVADGNSPSAIHATGEIRLPATLPPGEYAVGLSAYDRSQNKQRQTATQWVDFTLVK